jgi:hypothetical protein
VLIHFTFRAAGSNFGGRDSCGQGEGGGRVPHPRMPPSARARPLSDTRSLGRACKTVYSGNRSNGLWTAVSRASKFAAGGSDAAEATPLNVGAGQTLARQTAPTPMTLLERCFAVSGCYTQARLRVV